MPRLHAVAESGADLARTATAPTSADVADSLVVVENDKAIQTVLVPLTCR